MKILIVNRFFGGAQIPTGRMAEDVARLLVDAGHEVSALASTGTYAGAEKRARDQETKRLRDKELKRPKDQETAGPWGTLRVEEVRVPKWMPRALAWLWFTWQARQRIPRMEWDVCVLMTDPPLLPLLAARVKAAERLRDCGTRGPQDATRRVTVWLMDLYPEALAASGRIGTGNPLYKWYFGKRQQSLAAADLLICLGQTQKELLSDGRVERGAWSVEREAKSKEQRAKRGHLAERMRTAVVPPWDDRGNIALATEESLKNLALYAGNLGEAHCFEEILAAAPYLPADWTIRFAARGAKLGALKEKAEGISHGLTRMKGRISPPGSADRTKEEGSCPGTPGNRGESSYEEMAEAQEGAASLLVSSSFGLFSSLGARVEVTGYASEEETPALLASARVHLITMSPGWEGIVVPSKLYGCIRTGRPVLFIGPENADTAREIRAHDWGLALPPGANGEEVAAAILELAARPTRATESQNGAREVAELIETVATADRRETDNSQS